MPALLALEASLERVRSGLESRSRRISGRVGEGLAEQMARPGKMLRARFCLLLGAALGVETAKSEAAARGMEFVHNASLLHDDCVDLARLRRGRPTPNEVFGVNVALLLGDLAFAQGLEEVVDLTPQSAKRMISTAREMAVGELQEEFLKGSVGVTVEAYLGVISRKTGALFEWCGATLAELSPLPHADADPPRLGSAAGMLLQVIDDIQDYTLTKAASGKEPGRDLCERRLTLPAILALNDPAARPEFLRLWEAGGEGRASVERMASFLESSGHMEAARGRARELVRSIRTWAAALPVKEFSVSFCSFIDAMERREF
ncbi:MAG: polyprenyl synthetase family protein [Elusimicrobia bacterium]|nr:polyprenyl synthetase family protein [Elusimicrobiota bacterium]